MVWLLAAHFAAGAFALLFAGRLGRAAFAISGVPMAATATYAAARSPSVLRGDPLTEAWSWVPLLDLAISLRVDAFSLVMVLIISGIGVGIMVYGSVYFGAGARAGRTAGLLALFAGAMAGIVVADNLALLYVAWELTSITSFLLIGLDHERAESRSAALHALLVTGAGGLALLGGLVLLAQAADTWSLSELLAEPPSGLTAGVGLSLVLVGIVTKSAQYPTHAWLPGAMVAPTPVSAYLHSATMVKAGIYLAARFAPAFAAVGVWRPAVIVIGLFTMLAGALRALRQHDLKLLLAMGTVSQLGFLLVLFGVGIAKATLAGVGLLIAHALFKCALFLVVGIIDHQAHTRDIRVLDGFGRGWGAVKVTTVLAAASMAGLPPTIGFVAKEAAFEGFADGPGWGVAVIVGLVGGSALSVAYTARFAAAVLRRPSTGTVSPPAPSLPFAAPAVALAALSLAFGAVTPLIDPLASAAATALDGRAAGAHLALWHGIGFALLMSALTLGFGVALVALRTPLARLLAALAPQWGGMEAYAGAVRGLNVIARRSTGVVQNGSLPLYIAVILLTAVVVPSSALLALDAVEWPALLGTPGQGFLAAVIIVSAVGAARASRRFVAVILLGSVGYAMALLFVLYGAPDLALTQFAVETLLVVAFVLVVRLLPSRFMERRGPIPLMPRLAVAGLVGAMVFAFALVSAGARRADPIGPDLVGPALSEAGGRNVVNVVLVDFRGLDTLGEISVIGAAALGVVALGRIRRSRPTSGESG